MTFTAQQLDDTKERNMNYVPFCITENEKCYMNNMKTYTGKML